MPIFNKKNLKGLGKSFLDAPANMSKDAIKGLKDISELSQAVIDTQFHKGTARLAQEKLGQKADFSKKYGGLSEASKEHGVVKEGKKAHTAKLGRMAGAGMGGLSDLKATGELAGTGVYEAMVGHKIPPRVRSEMVVALDDALMNREWVTGEELMNTAMHTYQGIVGKAAASKISAQTWRKIIAKALEYVGKY